MLIAHVLAYQLIGRRVGHWCKRPDYLRHLSQEAWRNVAIPLLPDGTFSGCTVYDPPVEGEGAERPEVPCREWDYEDKGYPDSIVSMWNLVCDRQWLYQFSFFLYMVGPVFSAPVAGALADRFGRRPVIITLLWAFSFASMVSAVANSFFMFLMARLVSSATSYAAFALLFILLYEVTDNEHRAILAFVSSAVVLTLSPPVLNVVSRMKPSWYLAHIFLIAPTVLLAVSAVGVQWLPELVFFKKEKTKQVASPEVMSEKQRKEMIKASLPPPRKMSTTTRIRSPRPRSDKPRARSLKRGSPSLMEAKSRKSVESLQLQYGSTKTNSPEFVQSR
ncbi:solute carrier family 22 member 7-like [Haemaphysalis longicornis]